MGGMSTKRMCVMFCGGIVLLVTGGIMIPVVDMLVRDKIKETVIIANGSELWDVWSAPPIPIYMQFYMLNLSNPLEVKEGKRPVVVQKGPYTYEEKREKYNITFNDNGTVTYRQRRTFFFLRDMSVGPDTENFTVPNPPVLAVVNSLQYANVATRNIINLALRTFKEDIFMARSVKELLWGYNDTALEALKRIHPEWFYTSFVGYFVNKNDTDDGLYTVFTGSNDVSNLGMIDTYNNSKLLPYWTTRWANMINGSDGTVCPPFVGDKQQLPMFSSDICRSIYGVYQKNVKTRHSISLRRYVGAKEELENATANPDNIGFCTPQTNCLPTGLLNMSTCQIVDYFHIPVIASFPHFYMGDPKLVENVGGMHPVPEEHETAVDVEPWTGLVLQVAKRLQINMYLTKVEGMSITGNIPTMFLPVFWLNESMKVDEKHATMLQRQLFAPMEICGVLEKVFMIIGSGLILLVLFLKCRGYKKSESKEKVLFPPPGPPPTTAGNNVWRRPPRSAGERVPLLNGQHAAATNPPPPPPPVSSDRMPVARADSTEPVYHSPVEA